MAAAALPSFFTDASSSFGAAPSFFSNNFGGVAYDNAGPLSLAMADGGASFINNSNNYADLSNSWEYYTNASIFSMSPLSDSSYDESELLLMNNSDSDEFLQQIDGSNPVTMHPNLVHTLKYMVAPGQPGSVGGTMYTAEPSVLDRLEQQQEEQDGLLSHDRFLRSTLLRQFGSSQPSAVVPKAELPDLSPPAGAVIHSPVVTEEPLEVVEKSETEENIEAAVVSVDLIKNRRPFRCQHGACNKTFKNPQTMKMHHKTHYSDGSAGAQGCTLPTLTSSLKAGHNKKTPSRCPKCKKTFVGLYELRRHYGRKHSEGEKPFGCHKCGKKFYIEVDVRDHEKLCGKPIECKCGLKFAFKCNLVAHKKAHPACQDHDPATANNNSSSSDDSEQTLSTCGHQQLRTGGTKRVREESTSPIQSGMHIPVPDFKCIPEAPEFKLARLDFPPSGGLSFPPETNPHWVSNMVYPTISFANLPYSNNTTGFHCQFKASQPPLLPFDAANCEMGIAFNQLPFKAWSG